MPFSWTLTWLFMFLLTFTVFLCLVFCRAWCRQSHKATRFLLFTIRCCSKHVLLCYFFRPLSVPCSWLGCIIIIINENLLFSHQPIKWQNLPVPSRVTSWNRGPSRAGSQVALGTRLMASWTEIKENWRKQTQRSDSWLWCKKWKTVLSLKSEFESTQRL